MRQQRSPKKKKIGIKILAINGIRVVSILVVDWWLGLLDLTA